MRLTGSFVLPQDVELRPVLEFAEDLRRSTGAADSDFALSRPNSRSPSKIVDAGAAQLISQFKEPSSIARAVARFSRSRPGRPERTAAEQILEEALPLLRSLVRAGLLVEAGSNKATASTESLAAGDSVDGWTVVRCVQFLEDTELYLVSSTGGQWGALKIARPDDADAQRMLHNEIELLHFKGLTSLPKLLASGVWEERPYLVTEWISASTPNPLPQKSARSLAPICCFIYTLSEPRFLKPTPISTSMGLSTVTSTPAISSSPPKAG